MAWLSEMKYIIFFSTLYLLVPVGAIITSYSRRIQEFVFILFLFSTVFINRYDINLVYRGWYRSPTRGLEISFVDLLAVILFISLALSTHRKDQRFYWPPSLGLMLAYLTYGCFTIVAFDPKLFGLLEMFKLLRGLLAFLVVAFYVRSSRDIQVFLLTFVAILIYEGCLSIIQRYVLGSWRVRGTFVHPPALANYICLLAPVVLAVALANVKQWVQSIFALAWALGVVAVILSITRMGVFVIMLTSGGVLFTTLVKQMSPRKVALASVCGLLCLGFLARGFGTVMQRHQTMSAGVEAGDESAGRKVYYLQTWEMVKANPFGAGLNNYAWCANAMWGVPYDSTSDPGAGTSHGLAHSAFMLTFGDLGWPGIVIFVALWVQWFVLSGRFLFSRSPDLFVNILAGCFFAILAAALSALTEHNFRNQMLFIVFNILMGFMVAVRRIHLQHQKTLRDI